MILRPEPGASETAARAAALGFETLRAPLFAVAPVAWEAPPADTFDALLITSANTARHGGERLRDYAALPCLAVGEATAAAAERAGIIPAWTGSSNGKAALAEAAERGYQRVLWLCGRQHTPLAHPKLDLTIVPVYSAEAAAGSAALTAALAHPAIILVHSQRAAWALAAKVGEAERHRHGLVAISAGVAAVAGEGWAWTQWPARPLDEDMLELAASLCQKAAP